MCEISTLEPGRGKRMEQAIQPARSAPAEAEVEVGVEVEVEVGVEGVASSVGDGSAAVESCIVAGAESIKSEVHGAS